MLALPAAFRKLKCATRGHRFMASRSEDDVEVCVRCRLRRRTDGQAAAALSSLTRPEG